ncbi:MAG TPA: hypothetical protein VH592_09620 [Gemmataceae bacterium]|jgi:hypothetical protein
MNKRWRLWLLLLLLLLPLRATAQGIEVDPSSSNPLAKKSHYPVPGEFDSAIAQMLMAQRLPELQKPHQVPDQLKEMFNDRKFLEGLKNSFSESQLRELYDKLNGKGVNQDDPNWRQLLQYFQDGAAQREIDGQQIGNLLSRWAKGTASKSTSPDSGAMMSRLPDKDTPTPPSPPSLSELPQQPSVTKPPEPRETSFERFQVKSTQWLLEQLDDFGGDMLQSIAEMRGLDGNSSLAELLRSVPQSDFSGININDNPLVPALRSGTFSHYLSRAGDFLRRQNGIWDGVGSLFRQSPLPSLSNISGPSVSLRAPPSADGDGWLPASFSLLMLGVLILLLYKRGFGSKSSRDGGEGEEWRLGSWPVPPGAVSTRQDVIRAFEYLALLCLGPAAAACHHRQLAQRLAEHSPHPSPPPQGGREHCSPSPLVGEGWGGGNAGRRQAAEMLAWLYEQARYAPAAEALSPEQLSDARHALCLLAGVTAA